MNLESSDQPHFLTHDELLELLQTNRSRVRTACNTVLGVSGVLLSVVFVTLFFVLKDKPELLQSRFHWLLFLIVIFLFISLCYSVAGFWLPREKAVLTKLILINELTTRVRNESRKLRLAIVFLFLSIIVFIAALGLVMLFVSNNLTIYC